MSKLCKCGLYLYFLRSHFRKLRPTFSTIIKKSRPRHKRQFWYNPPFDGRVNTHVIQRMFAALDKCYPPGHRLHNLFNRHTVKASYRTLANMSKQLAIHNSVIIKEYNNNLVCQQQPCVPHATEVTRAPAPAPARSLSTSAVSSLHTPPTADTIITQQTVNFRFLNLQEPPFQD